MEINKLSSSDFNWITEDIDINKLSKSGNTVGLLATGCPGGYYNYTPYSNYYDYYNYSAYAVNYTVYYDYNNYYNYYNYSNYGNYYPVTIITNPSDVITIIGKNTDNTPIDNTVSFTVSATNGSRYQWYKSQSNTGTGNAIDGATSATYSFRATIDDNGMYYYCTVSNSTTATSSRAKLTVIRGVLYTSVFSDVYGEDKSYEIPLAFNTNTDDIALKINNTTIYEIFNPYIFSPESAGDYEFNISLLLIDRADNSTLAILDNKQITVSIYNNETEIIETVNKGISVIINAEILCRRLINTNENIHLNQMVNVLTSKALVSKKYNTIGELALDIATTIKNKYNITSRMTLPELVHKALELQVKSEAAG